MSTRMAPARETDAYRPLEPLAIVALLMGVASVLVFFVDAVWFLFVLPIPAIMLAYVARRRIMNAQGQLGGYVPSTLALAASLVCTVGWVTSYFTARWIIESEAMAYADAFLQKVLDGKEGEAFLATVKPVMRNIHFSPTDLQRLKRHFPPPKGGVAPEFDNFRHNKLMSILFRSGKEAKIRLAARPQIRSKVEGEFFDVKLQYNLQSPYNTASFTLTVSSDYEPIPSGRRRSWYILITNQELGKDEELTDFGKEAKDAAHVAGKGVQYLASLISAGHREKWEARFKDMSVQSRNQFEQMVKAIRQDAAPTDKVEFGLRLPLLIVREEKLGDMSWRLTVQSQFEPANREIEFEITMETPNLKLEQEGWSFSAVRFLGERRKFSPQLTAPTPPPIMDTPPEIPR